MKNTARAAELSISGTCLWSLHGGNMLEKVSQEAVRELDQIRRPSLKEKAKAAGKSLLGRGNALVSDVIFWPAGLLLTGLVEAGQTGEAEAYLAEWIRKGCAVQNPDDALTGSVLLTLYEETGKDCYREAAGKVAAYLRGCIRDKEGSIVYGQRSGNRLIYADGAGQTALFLARYARVSGKTAPGAAQSGSGSDASADQADSGRRRAEARAASGAAAAAGKTPAGAAAESGPGASSEEAAGGQSGGGSNAAADQTDFGRQASHTAAAAEQASAGGQQVSYSAAEALEDARRQLVNYARYGMDARSGLPYHGYDLESGIKYGIIGWGRAIGWLLLGLSEYLCDAALYAAEETGFAEETGAAGESAAFAVGREEHLQVQELAQGICRAVAERVRPDGMLSWQPDCLDGPLDSSATGMIFYALLRMNRFRTAHPELPAEVLAGIPQTDPALIDAAAAGLRSCIAEDGKVWYASAECFDFSQYSQQYGNYAWGQGSVLAFLSIYDLK